jgi:hypothetical protein
VVLRQTSSGVWFAWRPPQGFLRSASALLHGSNVAHGAERLRVKTSISGGAVTETISLRDDGADPLH